MRRALVILLIACGRNVETLDAPALQLAVPALPCDCGSKVIATDQEGPLPLVVAGGVVYWANIEGQQLMRAVHAPEVLREGRVAYGIAVSDGQLYWADFHGGRVDRMPAAGGPSALVAELDAHLSDPMPYRLAVGTERVWWSNVGDGSVMSAPKSGGTAQVVMPSPFEANPNVAYIFWAADVALAGDGPVWSYTGRTFAPGYSALMRGEPPSALVPKGDLTSVAVDRGEVFFTDRARGTVEKVPLGGGTPVKLAEALGPPIPVTLFDNEGYFFIGGIAVDAAAVYWIEAWVVSAENRIGRVRQVPREGGEAVTLATSDRFDSHQGGQVAVDADFVFWTNHGEGTVNRLKK